MVAAVLAMMPLLLQGLPAVGVLEARGAGDMNVCARLGCSVVSKRAGEVFVAEDFEPTDAFRPSGKFSAHWQDGQGGHVTGPEGVSVNEAIEWGRRMAPVVLVRLGDEDEFYSAGDDQPDPPVRDWPTTGMVVRSRPDESARDGSEQIVTWALESTVQTGEEHAPELRQLREEIRRDARLEEVKVERAGRGTFIVRYTVRANGGDGAAQVGDEVVSRAVKNLMQERSDGGDGHVETSVLGRSNSGSR
jgi:hypothetical protein